MVASIEQIISENNYVLFAGVGNLLKKDDGVGVYISKKIKNTEGIQSIPVEMSIENYIGKINQMQPDVLILIDATDFRKQPGYWKLVPASEIRNITSNTHNISLKQLAALFNMPVYILGIQVADISFGEGINEQVKSTADQIIKYINQYNTVITETKIGGTHVL